MFFFFSAVVPPTEAVPEQALSNKSGGGREDVICNQNVLAKNCSAQPSSRGKRGSSILAEINT